MTSRFLFVGLFLSLLFSCTSFLFLQAERINFHRLLEEGREVKEIIKTEYRTAKKLLRVEKNEGTNDAILLTVDVETTGAGDAFTMAVPAFAQDIEIPLFPGCEQVAPFPRRAMCSFRKLATFLGDNVEKDRFTDRKGQVILRFDVPLSGVITHARIDKDTDAHLAAEMMRLFGVMQGKDIHWNPGKQNGKAVPMQMAFKFNINQGCGSDTVADWAIEELFITD